MNFTTGSNMIQLVDEALMMLAVIHKRFHNNSLTYYGIVYLVVKFVTQVTQKHPNLFKNL